MDIGKVLWNLQRENQTLRNSNEQLSKEVSILQDYIKKYLTGESNERPMPGGSKKRNTD